MKSPSKELKRFQIDVHDALDMVEHYYPVKWYERTVIPAIIGIFMAVVFAAFQVFFHVWFDWRLGSIAIFMIIIGEALDIHSTAAVMRLRPLFLQRKLSFPVHETNPLLPQYPKVRDLVFGKPALIAAFTLSIALFFPSIGVQVGITKFCVILSNHRKKLRVQRVLDFAQGKANVRVRDFFPEYASDRYVRFSIH